MAKAKAEAKTNKQCPICRMEVDSNAETCPGCAAVFDDSPTGATPPAPTIDENDPPDTDEIPDDEAAPNGEAEEAEADTEENSTA